MHTAAERGGAAAWRRGDPLPNRDDCGALSIDLSLTLSAYAQYTLRMLQFENMNNIPNTSFLMCAYSVQECIKAYKVL